MSKGWGVLGTALVLATLLFLPSQAAAAGPGEPDPSFSGDGFALPDLQVNSEEANGVAEAPDGKIIVGGWAIKNSPSTYIPFLVRLLPDGTL